MFWLLFLPHIYAHLVFTSSLMGFDLISKEHETKIEAEQGDAESTTTTLFPDLSLFEEDSVTSFEDEGILLNQWAMAKIGTFQSRLEEAVRTREQSGQKKSFLKTVSTAELLRIANEAFGFNGWSSQILSCESEEEIFDEENSVFSMKQKSIVRIILQDGTYIEAHGIGESLNMPQKYMCLSNCKKMAITNGLRNGLLGLKDLLFSHEENIKVERIKKEFN